jgi:UDP-glucuronate 4-epimerase
MSWLVTGSAGFIGFHVASHLLDCGECVIGIDNLNPYYDVGLKRARLAELTARSSFEFHRIDLTDLSAMTALVERHRDIDTIIHLAAQAGVRHSLADPLAYVEANVKGQVVLLEAARKLKTLRSLVYASSSSVYGNSAKQPFSIEDRVEHPVSLYAATKRAGELITESYCQLYALPCTGLRFFTLYGPWGRPDMAYYSFTEAILAKRPIKVFNEGRMARDFTYVDDALPAILAAASTARAQPGEHRLYNIGSNRPESLLDFIAVLENAVGCRAIKEMVPMQPGDVVATYADIESARRDLGFEPKTPITIGLPRFVAWYREYNRVT